MMKKRLCLFVVLLILISSGNPGSAFGADKEVKAAAVTVTTQAALESAIESAENNPNSPTEIIIGSNITLSNMLTVPENKYISFLGKNGSESLIMPQAVSGAHSSETYAALMVSGNVSIKNLSVDAKSAMRCLTVLPGGTVTLDTGAEIKNGKLGNASSNGGACIRVQDGSKSKYAELNMKSGSKVTDGRATGEYKVNGIGIYVGSYGNFAMTGGTVRGHRDLNTTVYRKFSEGGGVYLSNYGGTFTMSGGSVEDNYAKSGGGGVYVGSGTFNLDGGSITGNSAVIGGAGIYTLGTVNMNAGVISENTAVSEGSSNEYGCGGGVFVGQGTVSATGDLSNRGAFYLNGGAITNNSAKSNAANNQNESIIGQGGGVFADGEFYMNGGLISSNTATCNSNLTNPAGCGGGVSVGGGLHPGYFYLNSGTIKENFAQNEGGGVYLNNHETDEGEYATGQDANSQPGTGLFQIKGNPTAKANTNRQGSNNIYLPEDGMVTVADELGEGTELYLHSAVNEKGTVVGRASSGYRLLPGDVRAFYNEEGRHNYTLNQDGTMEIGDVGDNDYISVDSAALSAVADETFKGSPVCPEPTVTLGEVTLQKGIDYVYSYRNNVNAGEATVRVMGIGDYTGSVSATFDIMPKDISALTADSIRDRIYTGEELTPDAGLYHKDSLLKSGVDYLADYSDNINTGTASIQCTGTNNYTGTITRHFDIISQAGRLTADDELSLNTSISNAPSGNSPVTVYILKSIDTAGGITIPENKNIRLVGNDDDISISAVSAQSQLIRVDGTLRSEHLVLDGNGKCRVVSVSADGHLNLSVNSMITGGANTNGSGIHNLGTVTVDGGTICDNANANSRMTTGYGGGIHNAGTLTVERGEIRDNLNTRGGAVYNRGTAMISNALISDNRALGSELNSLTGEGGGIYNTGSLTVSQSRVTGNTASEFGGGIYSGGNLTTNDVSIANNDAGRCGGGVYTADEFSMNGGLIDENTVENHNVQRQNACGGGVYVGKGTFTMNEGYVINNSAKSTYVSTSYYASLGNGGGVYVSNDRSNPCIFNMNGGVISNNTAKSSVKGKEMGRGGGVYVMGGDSSEKSIFPGAFFMEDGQITSNSSTDDGSGIFVNNREDVKSSTSSTSLVNFNYKGNAVIQISGSALISGNKNTNGVLREGIGIDVKGPLTAPDGSIGVVSETSGNAVIASGCGSYSLTPEDASKFVNDRGIRTVSFDDGEKNVFLKAEDISDDYVISVSQDTYVFTGGKINPEVTVSSKDTSAVLKPNVDYSVSYSKDDINFGTKQVTVTARGDYSGELTKDYYITAKDFAFSTVSVADQIYTGNALTPVSAVNVSDGGKKLLRNTDFRIVGYGNNVEPGMGTVTLEGINNYSGIKTVAFRINKQLAGAAVSAVQNQVYNGRGITPAITVTDGGKTLILNTDYTVAYQNNVNTGVAKITITGQNHYFGSTDTTFRIIPKKAALSRMKAQKKRAVKLTWKRDKQANGYEVVIALNKKFTKSKKKALVKKNRTVSKIFKKLKKRRVYYAKIRAYRIIDGKKYYGKYSSVKKWRVR